MTEMTTVHAADHHTAKCTTNVLRAGREQVDPWAKRTFKQPIGCASGVCR
jgi:hypothetical protein